MSKTYRANDTRTATADKAARKLRAMKRAQKSGTFYPPELGSDYGYAFTGGKYGKNSK